VRRAGLLLLALAGALLLGRAGAAGPPAVSGWLAYGNGLSRPSATPARLSLHPRVRWSRKLQGRVTTQALVARGVPSAGQSTVYVATSAGLVYALRPDGRVRWRVQLGRITKHPCPQIDGYGVTGTPVLDARARVLFAVDALGQLHALDFATGKERAGWPVQLYSDYRDELVWGALTLAGGSVYAATGAYCDAPMVGKVFRVDRTTRRVTQWVAVPPALGGGGGIWGWGGLAYSSARRSLLAVTGNALPGGTNSHGAFREWAGYGEHLVELSPDLRVRASSHPTDVRTPTDLDFVGSPVILPARGCGEVVAALNKNGRLYAWRGDQIERGVRWRLQVAAASPSNPLITQAAVWARGRSLYVVSQSSVVRVAVNGACKGRIAWSHRLRDGVNSTPTVAGSTVWFVRWRKTARLLGLDARTGREVARTSLGKDWYFVAPTVVGGRLYVGSWAGSFRALG
jgi:hypothetical protein